MVNPVALVSTSKIELVVSISVKLAPVSVEFLYNLKITGLLPSEERDTQFIIADIKLVKL